jgi:hypothetical protein
LPLIIFGLKNELGQEFREKERWRIGRSGESKETGSDGKRQTETEKTDRKKREKT